LTDSFFARPSTVQIVASVSMSSGSLDAAFWDAAALGGPPACSAGELDAQAASANERLAARAAKER